MNDPFNLARFVAAQQPKYEVALSEIKDGKKRSHWMWFVFPQFDGLGSSEASAYFAIRSVDEAKAYLDHPILGARIRECTSCLIALPHPSASEIFGYPDCMKFHSSMTLFMCAAGPGSLFETAIGRFFSGETDEATLSLIYTKSQ